MNVGNLVANIQVEGQAAFARDLDKARKEYDALAKAASQAGKQMTGDQKAAADLLKKTSVEAKVAASQQTAIGAALRKTAGDAKGFGAALTTSYRILDQHSQETLQTILSTAKASVGLGVALGAAVGTAIGKYAQFDKAMSEVAAATLDAGESASETEARLGSLSDAAIEAGARTVFSAKESANAIEELAKAGVSTADILDGGLDGALDLAAAGGLGVADAAEIAATALKTFGLEGSQMGHVADLLAAGAGKAQGSVTDMSAALDQSALVAEQTGLSIEETTAGLAAFAENGLLGSDAGTSFKTMLQSLTPTSTKAKQAMEDLGISAYDSQGNFVGLAEFAGQLRTALSDLTVEQQNAALKTIFGADAVRAASVLYKQGEQGIRDWIAAVDDQGFASKVAGERLDNLAGDWEAFTGALDSALISMGEAGDGPLRSLVQSLTSMVDAFNDLPDGVKQAGLGVTAGIGLITAAAGAIVLSIPKIVAFRDAFDLLGKRGQRAGRLAAGALKGIGTAAAIATAVAVVNQLGDSLAEAEASVTDLANAVKQSDIDTALEKSAQGAGAWTDSILGGSDKVKEGFKDLGGVLDEVAVNWDTRWAGGLNTLFDWADGHVDDNVDAYRDALENLGDALASIPFPDAVSELQSYRDEFDLTDKQVQTLIDNSGAFRDTLVQQADALDLEATDANLLSLALGDLKPAHDDAADGAEGNADALAGMGDAADDAEVSISDLADTIRGFGSETLDARAAQREFEAAVDDASAAIAENEKTLDTNSEAGRDNEAALDGIARAALDAAGAILEQTGNQEDASAAVRDGRQALIDMLGQFGITGEAAEKYADDLGLIPDDVYTEAFLEDRAARQKLEDLGYTITNLPDGTVTVEGDGGSFASVEEALNWLARNRTSTVEVHYRDDGTGGRGGGHFVSPLYANGGLISGGVDQAFADGGFPAGIYPGRPGGIHKFAEPETIWEAYISGRPSARERNKKVATEAVHRLGGEVAFADGGIVDENNKLKRLQSRASAAWRAFNVLNDQWKARGRIDDTEAQYNKRFKAQEKADKAQDALEEQREVVAREKAALADRREDFNRDQARGNLLRQGTTGGGLGLVDQLLGAAEETGGARGKAMRRQALASEKAYLRLEKEAEKAEKAVAAAEDRKTDRIRKAEDVKAGLVEKAEARRTSLIAAAEDERAALVDRAQDRATAHLEKESARANGIVDRITEKWTAAVEKAASKVDDLRSASDRMATAVANTIRSKFDLGVLSQATTVTRQVTDRSSQMIDGIRLSTSETRDVTTEVPVTGGSVLKGLRSQAKDAKALAGKIKRLGQKGFTSAFINEVLSLGVEQAEPMIDALLTLSASEVGDTNSLYNTINKAAGSAGKSVADRYYADSIKAAEKQLHATKQQADRQITAANARAEKIITNAEKWGDRQVAQATRQGDRQVAQATRQGDRLVASASKQGDRQIHAATQQANRQIAQAKSSQRAVQNSLKSETKKVINSLKSGLNALKGGFRKDVNSGPLKVEVHKLRTDVNGGPLVKQIQNLRKELITGRDLQGGPKNVSVKRAFGGAVLGPGTATSDSILARLSNGEHVWTAAEVRALGGHAQVERLRAAAVSGVRVPTFAAGGPVQYVPSRPSAWSASQPQIVRSEVNNYTIPLVPREDVPVQAQARDAIRAIDARRRRQ